MKQLLRISLIVVVALLVVNVFADEASMRKRSSQAAKAFGKTIKKSDWILDSSGGRIQILSASGIRVAFSKADDSLLTVTDTEYLRSRMKFGPGQGNKFSNDQSWHDHALPLIQHVWPGSKVEKPSTKYIGKLRSSGLWGSSSNAVSVRWKTEPVNGKSRLIALQFDQETGKLIAMSRGRPF